ncbi:MAG: branched-chain amino acid transport system permease protein [Solirubrobacteraceae bacterium]|nr:branched-chain amino acid transport system permease protein [Solirubrobacteraceae bacterium]
MSLLVASIGFGLVTASILAVAAVGFTLQFGVTNILNLAFGDVMTASAFVAYIATSNGVNIWLAVALCALFGAAFSALLNRFLYTPFVRHGTKLFGMIVVTIAVSLIIQNALQAIYGASFFSLKFSAGSSYHIGSMVFTTSQVGIMAIAVVAMLGVYSLLKFSKLGKAMRATASDPVLARSCGIATDRVIDVAWLLSGALCGIAGVALAMNVTSFTSTTGGTFLIAIVAAAVLGGVGQAYGAMLGALTIGICSEVAAGVIAPSYKQVVAFVVLVLVLLIRPQGILSEVADQKEVAA